MAILGKQTVGFQENGLILIICPTRYAELTATIWWAARGLHASLQGSPVPRPNTCRTNRHSSTHKQTWSYIQDTSQFLEQRSAEKNERKPCIGSGRKRQSFEPEADEMLSNRTATGTTLSTMCDGHVTQYRLVRRRSMFTDRTNIFENN